MPKRTDISIFLALGLTVALIACSDNASVTQTTTTENPTASVSQCMDRFADRGVFGEEEVRASFVYDISELPGDGVREFWGRPPEDGGNHTGTVHFGDGADAAIKQFLASDPKGDTEMFHADDVTLIRVNDQAAPFSQALQIGCDRLRDTVTIQHVTFSKG